MLARNCDENDAETNPIIILQIDIQSWFFEKIGEKNRNELFFFCRKCKKTVFWPRIVYKKNRVFNLELVR